MCTSNSPLPATAFCSAVLTGKRHETARTNWQASKYTQRERLVMHPNELLSLRIRVLSFRDCGDGPLLAAAATLMYQPQEAYHEKYWPRVYHVRCVEHMEDQQW